MDSNFSIGSRPQIVSFRAGVHSEQVLEKLYTVGAGASHNHIPPVHYISDMSKGFDSALGVMKKIFNPRNYLKCFVEGAECVKSVFRNSH